MTGGTPRPFGPPMSQADADRIIRSPDLGWPADMIEEARDVRRAALCEGLHPDELCDQRRNRLALEPKPLPVIGRIGLALAAIHRLYHWHRPADQAQRNDAIRTIEARMARLRGDA